MTDKPINNNEEIICRFEMMIDGKWVTYLKLGPFPYKEMKKSLKNIVALADAHDTLIGDMD